MVYTATTVSTYFVIEHCTLFFNVKGPFLTMKSAVVMRSTLVSRAFNISLKHRPISFLEILLIAQISVDETQIEVSTKSFGYAS